MAKLAVIGQFVKLKVFFFLNSLWADLDDWMNIIMNMMQTTIMTAFRSFQLIAKRVTIIIIMRPTRVDPPPGTASLPLEMQQHDWSASVARCVTALPRNAHLVQAT